MTRALRMRTGAGVCWSASRVRYERGDLLLAACESTRLPFAGLELAFRTSESLGLPIEANFCRQCSGH